MSDNSKPDDYPRTLAELLERLSVKGKSVDAKDSKDLLVEKKEGEKPAGEHDASNLDQLGVRGKRVHKQADDTDKKR